MNNLENLMDYLHTEGSLMAGMPVCTNVVKDMEIYGFIPMSSEGDFLDTSKFKCQTVDFGMKDTLIASDRLSIIYDTMEKRGGYNMPPTRVTKHEVHPILRCVSLQPNEGKKDLPLRILYIPQYRSEPYYQSYRRNVIETPGNVEKLRRIKVIEEPNRKKMQDPLNQEENPTIKVCYYEPNENELFFKRTILGDVRAVGEEFVVVCRRINSVTGNSVLELFNPEELYPVITNKKESTQINP